MVLEPSEAAVRLGAMDDETGRTSEGTKIEPPGALDGRWRELLDLERAWWQEAGPKERIIRARLGISPARYHQLLNRVIDMPEALEHDPMLVRRLRRLREDRRQRRVATQLGLPV